jgi:hypothetical protein
LCCLAGFQLLLLVCLIPAIQQVACWLLACCWRSWDYTTAAPRCQLELLLWLPAAMVARLKSPAPDAAAQSAASAAVFEGHCLLLLLTLPAELRLVPAPACSTAAQ